VTAAADEPAGPPSSRPRRSSREDAEKEPLVQRALDVLGAQFVRVDEGFAATPVASQPWAASQEE
jgi:hypothetical protein